MNTIPTFMDSHSHEVCVKCKIRRRIHITDEDPATLAKYKTCDQCRKKNKLYKRNQKMKLLRKLESMEHVQRQPVINISYPLHQQQPDPQSQMFMDPDITADQYTLQRYQHQLQQQPPQPRLQHHTQYGHIADNELSFENFLEKLSHNDLTDIQSLKFKAVIPSFIVKRYENQTQLVDGNLIMSVSSTESRIKQYKDEVKTKLKIHYLDRIFDILLRVGYTFKIRSTNWKNGKFYSQMLCHEDIGNKKKDLSLLVEDDISSTDELLEEEEDEDDANDDGGQHHIEVSNPERSGSESSNELHPDSEDDGFIEATLAHAKRPSKPRPLYNKNNKRIVTQPRNALMYPCKSRLNYSFDSATGQFNIDFNHTSHKSLPGTNPSDPKSILHTVNSAYMIGTEWMRQTNNNNNITNPNNDISNSFNNKHHSNRKSIKPTVTTSLATIQPPHQRLDSRAAQQSTSRYNSGRYHDQSSSSSASTPTLGSILGLSGNKKSKSSISEASSTLLHRHSQQQESQPQSHRLSNSDKSPVASNKPLTAFANALNDLHMNISHSDHH